MKVYPIPPALQRVMRRERDGEGPFCDQWDIGLHMHGREDMTCSGGGEIGVEFDQKHPWIMLCRECAHNLADALNETIAMVDAIDIAPLDA
jgi:hypothetical protein